MSLPFMKFFVFDFEASAAHLTLEEDGIYNRLLRHCWMSSGQQIPHDKKWIMRKLRVTEDEYEGVVSRIIDEFFEKENGYIYNNRQRKEYASAEITHMRHVESGRQGGITRAKNEKAKLLNFNNSGSSSA